MLKKISIAFVGLLGLVLAVGLVLPTTYRVERSLFILAPSEAVYAHVAEPRRWSEWTSWNGTRHPGGTWTFGGPAQGVGSVRSWSGEGVGRGTLSLAEANPRTGVTYQASLDEGRASAIGYLSLVPEGEGTRVTWVEEGRIGGGPLRGYLVPLVRARLGGGFEEGLGRLKQVAETVPAGEPLAPPLLEPVPSVDGGTADAAVPVLPPPPVEPAMQPAIEPVVEPAVEPVVDAGTPPAPEPAPAAREDAGPSDGGLGDAGEPRSLAMEPPLH